MRSVCNRYNDPDPPTISRAHNEYMEKKKRKDGTSLRYPYSTLLALPQTGPIKQAERGLSSNGVLAS